MANKSTIIGREDRDLKIASRLNRRKRFQQPLCSGSDAVKAFRKLGYEVDHKTGSHIILRHTNGRRLTIPNHRELAKGTLRAIIREAGISKGEFASLL
jgi:predicted RNA binding protein YcfA (HicA-like mRNA interferase family)